MATSHEPGRTCQAPDPELVRKIQTSDTKRYPAEPLPRHGTPLRPGERKYHKECRENARNEKRRTPESQAKTRDGVKRHRVKYAPVRRITRLIRDLVHEHSGGLLSIQPDDIYPEVRDLYDAGCATEETPVVLGWSSARGGASLLEAAVITHRNPGDPCFEPHRNPEDCVGERELRSASATLPPVDMGPSSIVSRSIPGSSLWWDENALSFVTRYRVRITPVTYIEDHAGLRYLRMHGLRIVVGDRVPRRVDRGLIHHFTFVDGNDLSLPHPLRSDLIAGIASTGGVH